MQDLNIKTNGQVVLRRSRFVFPKMKFNTLSIAQIKHLQRQENQPESHANWLILSN